MKRTIERLRRQRLGAYRKDPLSIQEHLGIEQGVLGGGYGCRQIFELVQNAADAILEGASHATANVVPGKIEILLDPDGLCVANTGAPLTEPGLEALLYSNISPKRGNEIGRFGLGFKSLLALKGSVEFIFPDGSGVLFDPERCAEEICEEFGVDRAPGMRLAWWIESTERMGAKLAGRYPWAVTIVRAEIGEPRFRESLAKELADFPAEFLLFLDSSVELVIDGEEIPRRAIWREVDGRRCELWNNEEFSVWYRFSRTVEINDDAAKADATKLHDRGRVPLHWAMPGNSSKHAAGRFWAWFPTETLTRVAGILNAPWKLNSDRTSLIPGPFNDLLMREAASLIVESLPDVVELDDPGIVLEAFPRALDRKEEVAAALVNELWHRLTQEPSVPDGCGDLRHAQELMRHPVEDVSLARLWWEAASDDIRRKYVHPTCLKGDRGSRLKELANHLEVSDGDSATPSLEAQSAGRWFEEVASTVPGTVTLVLRLAQAYARAYPGQVWDSLRSSIAIIPGADGELYPATKVVPDMGDDAPPGYVSVAEFVTGDTELCEILTKVLGVKRVEGQFWENELNSALMQGDRSNDYGQFWITIRSAPQPEREKFARDYRDQIKVRSRADTWEPAYGVLMPGALISRTDTDNQNSLLDQEFHSDDEETIGALNIESNFAREERELSERECVSLCRDLCNPWQEHCAKDYPIHLRDWQRRVNCSIMPTRVSMPRHYLMLLQLRGKAKSDATLQLARDAGETWRIQTVDFQQNTPADLPSRKYPHPLPWFVLAHGAVQIGSKLVPLAAVAARIQSKGLSVWVGRSAWDSAITGLGNPQPPIQSKATSFHLLWQGIFEVYATKEAMLRDELGSLWRAAAEDNCVPNHLPGPNGDVVMAEIGVTTAAAVAQAARASGQVAVTLDPETLAKWKARGAQDLGSNITPLYKRGESEHCLLVEAFPELERVLNGNGNDATCLGVSGLCLAVGEHRVGAACAIEESTLLFDSDQLHALSNDERWSAILRELSPAGWLSTSYTESLQKIAKREVTDRRAKVAAANGLREKLVVALGSSVKVLRTMLDGFLDEELFAECDDVKMAELFLAHHGPASLTELKDALDRAGLDPPKRWGTSEAREFVTELGFPLEFSITPTSKRDPDILVHGPDPLPPLHEFQEEVFQNIEILKYRDVVRRRAVISLPTGAGKTRVVGEAAVKLILNDTSLSRLVLWVAQSDELCEQAVQAFQALWLNFGTRRTPLRIARLWGGNREPKAPTDNAPMVVVASIQTLERRTHDRALDWLARPDLVVFDECHHAITKSYTRLLTWVDAGPSPKGTYKDREPMLLGMSATPFRVNDDEAERLSQRFDKTWFPANQSHLYETLRDAGVLTSWNYDHIESGTTVEESVIASMVEAQRQNDMTTFENIVERLNKDLARSVDRNDMILRHVVQATEQRILLFANSVNHARHLATRLQMSGIPAAAISGETPAHVRRYFLRQFSKGEIRVLCNHSVLSTGFDEPGVDLVLIARQVFSPVRYMQMVGRGLRGPKNGGTECCRIVTILDNLGRFEDRHPYHYCRQYYELGTIRHRA